MSAHVIRRVVRPNSSPDGHVITARPMGPSIVLNGSGMPAASDAEAVAAASTNRALTPGNRDSIQREMIADPGRFATLQAAVDHAESMGAMRVLVGHTWTPTTPLVLPSGIHLDLGGAGVIRRGWSAAVPQPQASKYTGALIRQESTSAASPTTGVKISGGKIESNGFTGPLIAMYFVEDLTLSDIDLDYTGAGDWCVTVSGSRINISNVNPRGGAAIFEDGLHVHADDTIVCDGINITGCHVESGDDMVALTTDDSGIVRHVAVTGITGSSQSGFLLKLAVSAATTGVLEHIAWSTGTALSGNTRNGGMQFINATGDRQKMRHITIDGATLRTGNTATVNPRGIYIDCGYDIILRGVIAKEFLWEQLYIDDVDLLKVIGCSFHGAASSAFPIARILSSDEVHLLGSTFRVGASGTGPPIRLLSATKTIIQGCGLLNIVASGLAVYVEATCGTLIVQDNWGTVASGTAAGVRVLAASGLTKLIYGGNDFEPLGGYAIYPANLPATMRVVRPTGTPIVYTLVSDILDIPAAGHPMQVEGQSGAADNLATIRLVSGLSGFTGQEVTLFRGGEDITVKHGTGNIKTATAADVVMTATASTVLHFAYDGTNWVQV